MKTPEQSARTGRTIGRVFQIILLGGVLVAVLPFATGMDEMDGIGIVVIGGFITLMGLIGTVVMGGRAKVMGRILSGDSILARWENPDQGTVILSKEGFFYCEELYTMKGYSCYISKAEMVGQELVIQYHMARRSGHSKYKARLPVPPGHEAGVQQFMEAVRFAWGDKPLPYDREEANKDLEEEMDESMDDEE